MEHVPSPRAMAAEIFRVLKPGGRFCLTTETLIPKMAALGLALPLRVPFGLLSDSVLWSLLCEEMYYFLYPALLFLRDRIGWRYLMALCWGYPSLHYTAHGSSCSDLPIVWRGLELDPRPTVLAYGMQTSGAS
jgi:hypothetical protein